MSRRRKVHVCGAPDGRCPGRWSLARQLLVLQAPIVGLLVAAGATIAYLDAGRSAGQAVEFATAELRTAQWLTDRVVGSVAEPVLAALLLGKSAEAGERGVELVVTEDTVIEGVAEPRDLVTILGNLIDNAVDAALAGAEVRPPLHTP